jgi:hypothetical protein
MRCRSSSCPGEGIQGEEVGDTNVGDGDALGQVHKDVAPSFEAKCGTVSRGAGAGSGGRGVSGGVAPGWRRCPPSAQHCTKSVSGSHGAV